MLEVLTNVLATHDLRLVLLAAVICAFGAATTISICARATRSDRRALWFVLLSICAGATVWATHFIAMLAYHRSMTMRFDPLLTTLSLVFGVLIMGAGFFLAIRRNQLQSARIAAGTMVGLGVVVLHYVGMAAVRMPGAFTYSAGAVTASIAFSVLFGGCALNVTFGPQSRHSRPAGALLLVLMIVLLHFTAMGATHLHHDMAAVSSGGGISRAVLATAVSIASLSVLLIGMTGAIIDQRVSARLATEAMRFRTLAEGAFEGLVVSRGGVIVDANAAARRIFGFADNARDQEIADLMKIPAIPDSESAFMDADAAFEVDMQRADGSWFPAEVCRRGILLPDGNQGEMFAVRDVSARKASEARIAHLALHDHLTDLPNRRFFMELANKAASQSIRSHERFALFALDLDDFKQVNDTHGHAAGDEVIRIAAERIAETMRDTDVAARFGGDEFALLESRASQPSHTIALAERLLHSLQAPISLSYGEVAITASIGIAFFPDDGVTVEDLMRNADTAMYRAKADGKATIRFFEPHMDAALVARRKLESRLRLAVASNAFTVVYQPIVDSVSRIPLGFEALVRWPDAELGMVMPTEFIPVAEETGLIIHLGEQVLRQACRNAMEWPSHLHVAVNLSAVQFRRKGLIEMVESALAESGLPGERLQLEVTETLLMDNRQDALKLLNELRNLGVRISMDDFGTGYSSLSYLQAFPFDKIKIDRVFVSNLASNEQNASIVRAVAAMGRSLRMRVVAEGVETNAEAEILLGLDCDEIQGYLIARPMAQSDVRGFLDAVVGPKEVVALAS
jgi:diguanylate cyclase (GGDEF)-like protein/PAS domain S-box-containing protein